MKPTSGSTITVFLAIGCLGATCAWGQISSTHKEVSSTASTGISVSTVNGRSVVTLNGKQIYSGPIKGQVTSRSSNINGVESTAVYDGDRLFWESAPGAAQQLPSGGGAGTGLDHQRFMEQHQQTVDRMKEEQRKFMEAHGVNNFNGASGGSGGTSWGGGSSSSGGGASSGGSGGSGGSMGGGSGGRSWGGSGGGSGGDASSRGTDSSGGSIGGGSQSGNAAISSQTINGSTVITYQGKQISVGPTQGRISTRTRSVNGKDYAAAFDGERVIWENVPGAAQQVK